MDENKIQEIFKKSQKEFYLKDYLKSFYKEEYFSNKNLMFVSFFLSSLLTIKFIKSKHLYREFHGHFNSPQTLLNKKLTINYLTDAFFRFFLGNVGFFYFFYSFKKYYLKINEPLFTEKEDIEEKYYNKNLMILEDEDNNERLVKEIGIDKINEENHFEYKNVQRLFDIENSLKIRNNLNRYYEDYKK